MPIACDPDGRKGGRRPVGTADIEAILTDGADRGLDIDYARKHGREVTTFRRSGGKAKPMAHGIGPGQLKGAKAKLVRRNGKLVRADL